MADRRHTRLLALSLLTAAAACAVPVPPSGGPVDSTPPSLVASIPENGAVGVSTDRVRLEFDEYVDERSASTSVTVTPAPSIPPEVGYGGRSIELRFKEPLRDSTTYIISIDTQFRDAHNVALTTPLTVAFSTGDVIDRGRLAGRVVDGLTGRPAASIEVFAYAAPDGRPPDSLDMDPAYRTQTDSDGRFRFAYLAERPFFVAAGRDVNRNRRLDPGEALALPPVAALTADTTGEEPDRPWLLAGRDRSAPQMRRASARSSSRVEILFSEGVRLVERDPASWRIADSTGIRSVATRWADTSPDDPRTIVLRFEPTSTGSWLVEADSAVADSAGNVLGTLRAAFVAVSAEDTVRSRFRSFTGDTLGTGVADSRVLGPWTRAGVALTDPLPVDSVRRHLTVRDTTGASIAFRIEAAGGARYDVVPDPPVSPGRIFAVDASLPAVDSVHTALFTPAGPERLGELAGVVSAPDTTSTFPVVVELLPSTERPEPVRRATAGPDGAFVIGRLPGGRRYRIRAFVDENADGVWTPGRFEPFTPAEPITWLDTVPAIRARWETALPDTLRIGSAPDRVPSGGNRP